MTTVNMSEFQEGHTVSRLIGSPPAYRRLREGGILLKRPASAPIVLLIDEVEKAHADVINLYQVFDKGTLADGEGQYRF